MPQRLRVLCQLPVMMVLALTLACQTPVKSPPLAEVDGEAITSEEVEKALGAQLSRLQEQVYNLKRQKVETLIADRLLAREAARRGISVAALLDAEVTSKVGLVTEQEIDTFYQTNKARLKGEEATVREQIRGHLQGQKLTAQREAFLKSLRSQAKVVVHLEPPPVFRAEASVEGAPSRGLARALVTIVEFEDFHCPYCKRVQPTLTQLLSQYSEKVKLVFRDFPIDSLHPQSRKAHAAARCANEQRKFWEFHDKVFAGEADSSPERLNTYAREVGLDLAAFERCLNAGAHDLEIQKDIEEGNRLGVTGTPTFFINGRLLSGAQPVENFVRLIDDELARAR